MNTFYGILIPFLGTTLGAACVFFLKKALSESLPVSYTHLDVYKRQDFANFKLQQLTADGSLECSVISEFHNKQLPPVYLLLLLNISDAYAPDIKIKTGNESPV